MAILVYQSNERGVPTDTAFAPCCGESPEVLHFKRGECYMIFCRRKGCINERLGVLTYDYLPDAHRKWEQFRCHQTVKE